MPARFENTTINTTTKVFAQYLKLKSDQFSILPRVRVRVQLYAYYRHHPRLCVSKNPEGGDGYESFPGEGLKTVHRKAWCLQSNSTKVIKKMRWLVPGFQRLLPDPPSSEKSANIHEPGDGSENPRLKKNVNRAKKFRGSNIGVITNASPDLIESILVLWSSYRHVKNWNSTTKMCR